MTRRVKYYYCRAVVAIGLWVLLCCIGANGLAGQQRRQPPSAMLSRAFRIMYDQGGTMAVLNGCQETLLQYKAQDLVKAALLAGSSAGRRTNKGISSGILNALLGCCIETNSRSQNTRYSNMAIELMKAYDDVGQGLQPDLVALCLAYVATTNEKDNTEAEKFLKRAEEFYASHPQQNKVRQQKPPNWSSEIENTYDIRVLLDTAEFLVVSKPSGMVCYHSETKQRSEYKDDKSLEECLLEFGISLSTLNQEGRGLVHRIDRGTSGCLVLAKTNRMHAVLLSQFFLRQSKKAYQALVCSSTVKRTGTIVLDIDGRPATSRFTVEKHVGKYLTRLCIKTEQGRRHQVRIHCSKGLNAPILLDPLYGGQSILKKLLGADNNKLLNQSRRDQNFCLHASSLTINRVGIDVKAPLPDWWQQLEADLGYK